MHAMKVGRMPHNDKQQVDACVNFSGFAYHDLPEIARYTNWQYAFADIILSNRFVTNGSCPAFTILDNALRKIRSRDPGKELRSISSIGMEKSLSLQTRQEQACRLTAYLYQNPLKIIFVVGFIFFVLSATLLILFCARQKDMQKIRETLYTDALTGFPNYQAVLCDFVELANDHPEQYTLIYMDIRRFKVINDTFGYEIGDQLLFATSNTLLKFVEQGGRMARVYADVFILLLHSANRGALLNRLDELSHALECSIGSSRIGSAER